MRTRERVSFWHKVAGWLMGDAPGTLRPAERDLRLPKPCRSRMPEIRRDSALRVCCQRVRGHKGPHLHDCWGVQASWRTGLVTKIDFFNVRDYSHGSHCDARELEP